MCVKLRCLVYSKIGVHSNLGLSNGFDGDADRSTNGQFDRTMCANHVVTRTKWLNGTKAKST